MKEITVTQLKEWKDKGKSFQLVDVREPHEREIATIHGLNIPLGDVPKRVSDFTDEFEVVVYCRSGKRSATAIQHIQEETGRENLYNLKGGILAWADEIDSSIQKY